MTTKKLVAVVDTNVWVDCYIEGRPNFKASLAFLRLAESLGIGIVYPVHILKDVFYIVENGLKQKAHEKGLCADSDFAAIKRAAWACVENMREHAIAVGADESDAWLACKYRGLSEDLEDNFVLAAAERAQADFIVTNDVKLIRKATVAAYTPQDALAYLKARFGSS